MTIDIHRDTGSNPPRTPRRVLSDLRGHLSDAGYAAGMRVEPTAAGTRIVIDRVHDVRHGSRTAEHAMGSVRRYLSDNGYVADVRSDGTADDAPMSDERRREILAQTPLGQQVLAGEARR